ncbi:hypothetical protein [Crocosphaera sp.]|uniref:hypothetical protein n=1 Tax=Crocosphaera sp. TaxID=2729996 RepID=UPI003F23B2B3
MIKKVPSMLLLSYMALTLGGCGLFERFQQSSEEPPVAESPQPPEENPDEVFEATTPAPSTIQPPAAGGLIPSTTPSERRQNIQPGRDNPFAVIPVQPVIRQKTTPDGIADPEKLCKLDEVKNPPITVAQGPGTATPISDVGLPPLLDPVLPIPNEARGVVVSGVMQLNGRSVAIVKAPNENVARQVTVGASLSNGQVRVKAINVSSARPYIVLEQYGLEIPRGVGEPAEEPVTPPTLPDGTPQPVAAAPSLPAPGPDGFGTIKNVTLLTLNIGEVTVGEKGTKPQLKASGTICNEGFSSVAVKEIKLQVEDKTTGEILDSFTVPLGRDDRGNPITVSMEPGQKAIFDQNIPKLRDREPGNVSIKLIDWS